MERRPIADSGLEVSVLSLGTAAMAGAADGWGLVDDRESIAAIHSALDGGVNLIDTDPRFGAGHAEEIVGKAVQGRRAEVLLATRCAHASRMEGSSFARGGTPAHITRDCEESLRRLRTDRIDIYSLDSTEPFLDLRDTISILENLLQQGKIRMIGLSQPSCQALAATRELGRISVVQTPYSMLHRRASEDLLPYCWNNRIAAAAHGVLARGLLSGRYRPDSRIEGIRLRDPEFRGSRYSRNLKLVEALGAIAGPYGKSIAQTAINWAVGATGVTTVVVGVKKSSQVTENLAAVGWSITPEDRDRIDRLLEAADET